MYETLLYHHGIKGQKWGIRRFQNPDGSLTSKGRKKYQKIDTLRSEKTGESFYIGERKSKIKDHHDFNIINKNGKTIGDLALENHGDDLYVNWISINSTERGKGYANKVMDYVVKRSKQNGYKTVSLEVPGHSPDARHIYEKHGFKEVKNTNLKTHEDDIWGGLTAMKRQN